MPRLYFLLAFCQLGPRVCEGFGPTPHSRPSSYSHEAVDPYVCCTGGRYPRSIGNGHSSSTVAANTMQAGSQSESMDTGLMQRGGYTTYGDLPLDFFMGDCEVKWKPNPHQAAMRRSLSSELAQRAKILELRLSEFATKLNGDVQPTCCNPSRIMIPRALLYWCLSVVTAIAPRLRMSSFRRARTNLLGAS